MSVTVVSTAAPDTFDGVGDFARSLAEALSAELLVLPRQAGVPDWRRIWRERHRPGTGGLVLLQYVPQSYFSGPEALLFFPWIAFLKFRKKMKILVTFHEYNVPLCWSLKRLAARLFFDAALLFFGLIADGLIATHELNRRKISRLLPWRRRSVAVIPIGSPLPDARMEEKKFVAAPPFVLFGQPEGMDRKLVKDILRHLENRPSQRALWLARSRAEAGRFLEAIGCGQSRIEILEGWDRHRIAALFSEDAIFLAPFVDGVSTRRSTLAAALGRGLPVAGTLGPCTNPELKKEPALQLAAGGDSRAFLGLLDRLVSEPEFRRQKSRESFELYARYFAWDKIGARYEAVIGAK